MVAPVLEYGSRPKQRSRAGRLCMIVAAGMVAFALAPMGAGARRVSGWIDASTGTMRRETTWFGFVTESKLVVSPFEKRLASLGFTPARDWRFLYASQGGGRECGRAPPIHLAGASQELVDYSTDAELIELAAVSQSPSEESVQRKAVELAIDRALKRADAQ